MENGLVNVARRLDPAEFQIHVCCLERGGEFAERLPDPQNISVLSKPPGFSPGSILRLGKVISRVQPNLIHSHNLGPLIYSSLATGLGVSRPILHGEHGLKLEQRTKKSMRQRRFFYRTCKKVQAVSHGLRQEFIEYGMPAEKILVIVNGVDTERFCPLPVSVAREKIHLPSAGPVLGIVGRFDPLKKHSALIEAFERLSKKFPAAQLLVVGDGGEIRDEIVQRAQNSPAAKRIHLTGFQKQPEDFYRAMDLLVSPSIYEGMSNVVLEAMACGVPVLAHTACGNSEVMRHNQDGIIANLETVDLLQSELEKILADPPRLARMGVAARENVVQRFSMAKMVEDYANLYRELAAKS